MKLKVQIVEDDINSIDVIKQYLKKFKEVEIIGTTADILGSYNFYLEHTPDILLVDIVLGDENIFTFIDLIQPKVPILFITGHSQYAIKAFRTGAIDYLQKPVTELEFKVAFGKMIEKAKNERISINELLLQRIVVETSSRTNYISIGEIIYLEASGSYTKFHLTDNSIILCSRTLKYYSQTLPTSLFIRISHRSLVNVHHLKSIEKIPDLTVILKGGIKIPISYRKKGDVFFHLEKSILLHSNR